MKIGMRRLGWGSRAGRTALGTLFGAGLAGVASAQAPSPIVVPPASSVQVISPQPVTPLAPTMPLSLSPNQPTPPWPPAVVPVQAAVPVPALPAAPTIPTPPSPMIATAPAVGSVVVPERTAIPGNFGILNVQNPPTGLPGEPGSPEAVSAGSPPSGPAGLPGAMGSPEAVSAGAPSDKPPTLFNAYWDNGLFFVTANKNFSAHVGAAVQYDGAWYSPTPQVELATGPFRDGVNLRRGRVYFEGTIYQDFDYKYEIEFFNGFIPGSVGTQSAAKISDVSNSPGPTDAWITVKNVPFVGKVRIGNQKEWFSLEHLNNYRFLEFMERSYLFDFSQMTAFDNGFSPGVSAFRTWADDRIFSGVGMYKNVSDLIGFGVGDGQYAVTGRLAALPIWDPDNDRFWHVGGAMSHRDPVEGNVQVRIRDDIRNAPFPLLPLVANTGLIKASSQDLFNVETAGVYGSFTFQGEYTQNLIHGASNATVADAGTLAYQGFYAETMYFLTGESRKWDNKNFFFRRVIPNKNFGFEKGNWSPDGWGAWEIASRYSYLNTNSQGINGGRLNAVTLGLNWYWNPNAKMQFNYDYTYRDGVNNYTNGSIHAFGTRVQYDF